MKRKAMKDLINWKNSSRRKPLLIYGARQVGKTWLMQNFGKQEYQNTIYINFENNKPIKEIFSKDLDTERLIKNIELATSKKISCENTLIIFDEIQECNNALVSLKYFCDNAPEYHIVAAGSFLGVAMQQGNSFPVGKVDMLTLYPLTFFEFLTALDEERFVKLIKDKDYQTILSFKSKFIERLKQYFYIGGMPEAVSAYKNNEDLAEVRQIQHTILTAYRSDFSKHINLHDIPKVGMIWNSIPVHLAKEKKKFMYKDIRHGARAREYENALQWLFNSNLIYKVNCVSLPNLPLISYQVREHFKVYMLDIGLLSAMAELDLKAYIDPNDKVFTHFKGGLTEQFVLQELRASDTNLPIFYWVKEKGSWEVDFVIQKSNEIIPIEVKSSISLAAKSLKVYMETYKPKITVRSSLADYNVNNNLYDIPLYMIGVLEEIVGEKI
ncbi:MAG: ATP-binding protein [Endomicrobium sp.]|jgi:predicted AAA+ superfamily ATPase|nr:ATP-binding protein [Endomicrobium sp.]